MRGYTLPEMLVSLAIGMILLGSTVKLGLKLSTHMRQEKGRIAVRGNLGMAGREITRFARGLEPEFMEKHPLGFSPVHPGSHFHGSMAFNEICEDHEDAACMTTFDIRPLEEEPVIYKVDPISWPYEVSLSPADPNRPPEPNEGVKQMSVLLFCGQNQTFCMLVNNRLGERVFLADKPLQPWVLPETPPEEPLWAVHPGFLEVTHIYLEEDPLWNGKLVYQPWTLEGQRWTPARSRSSVGQLKSMEWLSCNQTRPDSMILTGQARKAPGLTTPVRLGSREYNREVFCVSWEF